VSLQLYYFFSIDLKNIPRQKQSDPLKNSLLKAFEWDIHNILIIVLVITK